MTTSNTSQERADEPGLEKRVIEYLRSHPDFFAHHVQLLAELTVPHASGEAVSLIERQVSVLRDQNRQLRRELMDLVQVARDNDRLNDRVRRLTLGLMQAQGMHRILQALHASLGSDFDADAVALCLFAPMADGPPEGDHGVELQVLSPDDESLVAFKSVIEEGKPVCGRLRPVQVHTLFPDAASEVSSLAVIPLTLEGSPCLGLLAVGSFEAERFHPAMGTLFLSHIGAITTQALMPCLVS